MCVAPLPRSARVYPVEALMADCRQYFATTGRRVTFEYTLLAGVNDGRQHVRSSSPAQQRDLQPLPVVLCWASAVLPPLAKPQRGPSWKCEVFPRRAPSKPHSGFT